MTGTWIAAAILAGQIAAQQLGPGAPKDSISIAGEISVLADVVPQQDATELRPQIRLDLNGKHGARVRYRMEAIAEGLAADRDGRVTDFYGDVRDGWVEIAGSRADLRIGYGRLVWGRLDEIQPSDVINPLDTTKFLLDGRSAARLPVAFVRGRIVHSERLTIEGVAVPKFRRAVFDQLDEPTSPFNVLNDAVLPAGIAVADRTVEHREPGTSWENLSGGGRVLATIGRVDVTGAFYRGFDGFGVITFEPDPGVPVMPLSSIAPAVVGHLVERYPRFNMVSGDFETVVGEWAVRGETAFFIDKQFQGRSQPGLVDGHAIDAGAGVDRRAGNYRVFGSVILHSERSAVDPLVGRDDVNLVGSIERSFGRERYLARAFAVVNPADRSGFLRGLFVWTVRDNLSLDGSAGAFLGTGDDNLSRFAHRNFLFARARWAF